IRSRGSMQTKTNPYDAAGTDKESNETREALPVASPLAEPFIVQRERAILTDLCQLVAERAAVEPRLDGEFKKKRDAEAEDFEIDYQEVVVRFAAEKEKLERDFQEAREKIVGRYKTSRASTDEEYKTARKRALSQFEKNKLASKAEYQEARWTVTAVFEGIKSAAENERVDRQQKVADAARRIQKMEEEAR